MKRFWSRHLALWWLIPLIVVACILFASYTALANRRYERINGVAGELLPGHAIGQSFVSRYPNLSGVELRIGTYRQGGGPANATLVLHLRASPAPGPDLAVATLHRGISLDENPWYLFSFPPIPDSQDKPYYIEVESPDAEPARALTLFWWRHVAQGDPYAYGAAYQDGQPQEADLTFGLRYSPSPLDAWAQAARAASSNFPPFVHTTLFVLIIAGALWAMIYLPRILRDPKRRYRWLGRWSLPVALVVALVNGLIYVLLIPPWQGPDEQGHFAYAVLLEKQDLDDGLVQTRIAEGVGDHALLATINASMDRHDFSRRVAGHAAPGARIDVGNALYWQVRQPALYYWLCAAALRLARAAGIEADPYTQPENALRVMRIVSLALSLGVTALAWLAGTLLSHKGKDPWLSLLLPLTVTLLPMHAFVASVANNDILAELAVSALFVALVALLRWPAGMRGGSLAALAVVITLAGMATKSTAIAASLPLLVFGETAWLAMLAHRAAKKSPRRGVQVAAPGAVVLLIFALAAGSVLAAFEPQAEAAGWQTSYYPIQYAPRSAEAASRDGSFVIELAGAGQEKQASQLLLPPVYHPALEVSFSGWARLAADDGAPSTEAKASIAALEGSRKAGPAEVTLDPSGGWTLITGTARISESAEQVGLEIGAEAAGGNVQFDALTLEAEGVSRPWNDPAFPLKLVNPSAEQGTVGLRPGIARLLPFEARQMADVVANPQPFNKGALWGSYAGGEYRSFWGNFGWVSVPLPEPLYLVLGLLAITSMLGLAWLGVSNFGRWDWREWLAVIALGAFVTAVAIGFARQMTLLVTEGVAAYPQGRYLFVLIVPFAWLLLSGAHGIWSLATRHSPLNTGHRPLATGHWGIWLWLNALLLFAGFCLAALVLPYYYG